MTPPDRNALSLGTNVVELLLPHRRPFLFVDSIVDVGVEPRRELRAERMISANEEVFQGHFPNLHLWPGVYTIEGMGQSCYLLYLILEFRRRWEARGKDPDEVNDALRNLDRGFHLHPGYKPEITEILLKEIGPRHSLIGVSSSVSVKFLRPVFAGQRLAYHVVLTHEMAEQVRYEVKASVDEVPVAKGTMISSLGIIMPMAPAER